LSFGLTIFFYFSGIGLVSKKTKNHFQWVGGDVDTENSVENDEQEIANLRKRDAELTQAIEQQEIQVLFHVFTAILYNLSYAL